MSTDMSGLVQALLNRHPDRWPYLVHQRHAVTRDAVRVAVAEEAALFGGLGVGPGATVALQVPPSFTQVEVLLALWTLGAQVMLIDHRLKPAEVETLRALCRPQFVVRAGAAGRSVLGFQPRYELVTETRREGLPAGTAHRLVQFSSGSTGLPKVIGRTPESLAAELDRFDRIAGMPRAGDRVLLLSSTAHSFGLVAGLLHSLAAGAAAVFARRMSARDLLAAATEHRVQAIFGVPFHYELLGTAAGRPALPHLRVAVSGGEVMPPEVAARFADRYGIGVGESYGTTETGVIAMQVSGTRRPAVGPAAPGIRLRVRDGELEVWLGGSPYLVGPDGDRYADGWLRTHDRATVDGQGVVRLHGRGDSLVVVGGLKVDLTEVKAVLRQHPRVAEAVLVHAGVTEAYVAVRPGAAGPSTGELLRWCRDRLADYKLPRLIRVLPTLPRTSNGKLVRERTALHAAATTAATA